MAFGPFFATVPFEYNGRPSAPSITSPTNGTRLKFEEPVTITWNHSTDPDDPSTSLRYNIQYSIDNENWFEVPDLIFVPEAGCGLTDYDTLSHEFDAPRFGAVRFRIRCFDDLEFGPFASIIVNIELESDKPGGFPFGPPFAAHTIATYFGG